MSTQVKTPVFPESVEDGVVAVWHKKEGDFVEQDENLVDIETDKVVLEVPAPESGVLGAIKKQEGDTVEAGEILAEIGAGEKPAEKSAKPAQGGAKQESSSSSAEDKIASPSAKKLIAEKGLDINQIIGTGKDGRITKEDVVNSDEQAGVSATEPELKIVSDIAATGRPEKRVPMTRLRARIAERLVEAQQTAAILTTFNEVNLSKIKLLRSQYQDSFEKKYGVRLGFMSFFVKAAAEALKRYPEVNASIDGSDIVYHGYFDIGVAVSSPRGLVVPILRDADQMSLAEVEKGILDYALKAKENKLTIDEMTGGTFTISNGGVFGSLVSTPILNPPQSAILGMHTIQERPVVENGEIVIRPMMYLALSYDHRIIDGREAVGFLVTIKECLEDPTRLLLEI